MDEKIIVKGKTKKSALTLLKSLCFTETIFAVVILIAALACDFLFLIPIAGLFLLLGIMLICAYFATKKRIITVSNFRVYGTYGLLFPTDFDLPIDAINSIDTYKASNGFAIRTSSRTIAFGDMENGKEVASTISDLVAKRSRAVNSVSLSASQSSADELKKYKELFDSGVISQEEFDAKKKQLLDL